MHLLLFALLAAAPEPKAEETQAFPLWFPFYFVALWLAVGAGLSEASGWPRLARRYPGGARPAGESFRGQVIAMGIVNENNVTTLVVAPMGLHLSANLLFRFRRPPILVPWTEIRYVSERRFLWMHSHLLKLSDITTIRLKDKARRALRPYLTGAGGPAAIEPE